MKQIEKKENQRVFLQFVSSLKMAEKLALLFFSNWCVLVGLSAIAQGGLAWPLAPHNFALTTTSRRRRSPKLTILPGLPQHNRLCLRLNRLTQSFRNFLFPFHWQCREYLYWSKSMSHKCWSQNELLGSRTLSSFLLVEKFPNSFSWKVHLSGDEIDKHQRWLGTNTEDPVKCAVLQFLQSLILATISCWGDHCKCTPKGCSYCIWLTAPTARWI